MDQFQSEQDFVKLLPGMARRIAQVELQQTLEQQHTMANNHSSDQSQVERSSFGHYTSTDTSLDHINNYINMTDKNGHVVRNSESDNTIDITLNPAGVRNDNNLIPVDVISHGKNVIPAHAQHNHKLLDHSATMSRINENGGKPRQDSFAVLSPQRNTGTSR